MSWEAVGAVGEVLGAVGVIVSLVYLAAQIRQNTRQLRVQSRELRISAIDSIGSSFSRFRDPLIRDPELVRLWLRGTADFDALDDVEAVRLGRLLQELFFAHQNYWQRYQEGATTEARWQDHRQAIAANLRSPGIRSWWAESRSIYADEFEEVIEELLREEAARSADGGEAG